MVREWQRFVQGGVFCFWGEEQACWLFYATGQHVVMSIAPFELYQQYCPGSEPSWWPVQFFAIDRDFPTLRHETTLHPCFVIELYDWVQGSLTIGRQYTALLHAVKDGFETSEEDAAFYAEQLNSF